MSLFNWNGVRFPGFTMQQLNLDWILTEIKRVLGFFPEDGNPGTVLMKTEEGTAWEELPAIDININGVPEDTELSDTDKLIFYDVSSSANRKITAPNLLNSMMSNGTPLMDGTGSAGTSKKPARYDHRHPTDTSRAPMSFFQNSALKIENGGTGATTADDAIRNLNAVPNTFVSGNYTPSFSYTGTGATLTVANIDAEYFLFGGHVCMVAMRFNITDLGTHTSSENLLISLPDNVKPALNTTGPIGVYYTSNGISNLIVRASTYENGYLHIVNGISGVSSAGALTTGFQGLFAVVVF